MPRTPEIAYKRSQAFVKFEVTGVIDHGDNLAVSFNISSPATVTVYIVGEGLRSCLVQAGDGCSVEVVSPQSTDPQGAYFYLAVDVERNAWQHLGRVTDLSYCPWLMTSPPLSGSFLDTLGSGSDPVFSDITVRGEGGREFRAHKLVLAAFSKVLFAMFEDVQSKTEVPLPASDAAVECFLSLCYRKRVEVSIAVAADVCRLADLLDADYIREFVVEGAHDDTRCPWKKRCFNFTVAINRV